MSRMSTSIRVDREAKEKANSVFKQYGLSLSDGINIFLHQVVLNNGFPFEIKMPTEETLKALDELERKDGETFNSVDELFGSLED